MRSPGADPVGLFLGSVRRCGACLEHHQSQYVAFQVRLEEGRLAQAEADMGEHPQDPLDDLRPAHRRARDISEAEGGDRTRDEQATERAGEVAQLI